MAINVLDGNIEGQIGSTVSGFSTGFEATFTPSDTVIEGQIARILNNFNVGLSGKYTPPAGGSFDWTHGLGDLRVLASDEMSGFWGVGAASTTIIDTLAQLQTYETYSNAFSTLGNYVTYEINPSSDGDQDLFIDFRGVNTEIDIPLRIGNWRHVIILGLQMRLTFTQDFAWLTQYASDNGETAPTVGNGRFEAPNKTYDSPKSTSVWRVGLNLSQVNDSTLPGGNAYQSQSYPSSFDSDRAPRKGWNIHPRIPGGMMVRTSHVGRMFVEGCNFDAYGHQGDGFVSSRDGVYNNTSGRDFCLLNRRSYITNTRIVNYEGQSTHRNYGDGIHGDNYHSQGGAENSVYWENIVVISGQEGNVYTGGSVGDQGSGWKYHFNRNYQYILLNPATNYTNLDDYNPPGERSRGSATNFKFALQSERGERDAGGKWLTENYWCANKTSNILRFEDRTTINGPPYVNLGISPIDFAPVSKIGVNYNQTSPSNSYYNTLNP